MFLKITVKKNLFQAELLLKTEEIFKNATLIYIIFILKRLYVNFVTLLPKNPFLSAPRSGLAAKFGIDVGGIVQTRYTIYFCTLTFFYSN
jgi:hypothetical protein